MKKLLSAIWNVAFAVAIAVALSFGAATALSGTPDLSQPECDSPYYVCVEDDDCLYPWCPEFGGTCMYTVRCCVCFD